MPRRRATFVRLLVVATAAGALTIAAPARAVDEELVHDHAPRHGGVVGMAGTRHVEIVLGSDVVRVYLSDLHRVPLSLDGVSGTVTLRDAATPQAARAVALSRRAGALEGPMPALTGPTVDARVEATTPSGPLLIEFTLPVAVVPRG
jgi:hypothetical protein